MFNSVARCSSIAAILCCANSVYAADAPPADVSNQGFSYFMGLGQLQSRYQESVSIMPVKSKAQSSSLILISGALFAVNEEYLMSLDSMTTFYPNTATESWNATTATFNGIKLTNPLLQQNSYNLSVSNTQLYLHKRIEGDFFVFGGPSFASNSFRRYSFAQGPDKAIATPSSTTVEETSSEFLANVGIELESSQVRNAPNHYSIRLSAATPLWRRLQNTSLPQYVFSSAKGYDLGVEGRYSWAIHKNVQLGGWGRVAHSYRDKQLIGTTVELPASTLDTFGYGLELLWKL